MERKEKEPGPISHWRAGFAFGLLMVLGIVGIASAHANVVRSDPPAGAVLPGPPSRVVLWFNERIAPQYSEVLAYDRAQERVDKGDMRASDDRTSLSVSLKELIPGTYTIVWRALSNVDGHVTKGLIPFTVGTDAEATGQAVTTRLATGFPPSPWDVLIRWTNFLAGAVVVGTIAFLVLVLGPAFRKGEATFSDRLIPVAMRPLRRTMMAGLVVLALGGAAALLLQAMVAAEVPIQGVFWDPLAQILFHSRYGAVWLGRMALIFTLLALVSWLNPGGTKGTAVEWSKLALGGGLLLSTGLTSHAAAGRELTLLSIAMDWGHMVAMSIWLGGLVALSLTLIEIKSFDSGPSRGPFLASLVSRFSLIAIYSVSTLLLTGLYSTWLEVGDFQGLLETPYGRALLVKLLLVALMLLLGATNLLVVRPRLEAIKVSPPSREGETEVTALYHRLRGTVGGEALLGMGVLLVVGIMTSISPARTLLEVASPPVTLVKEAGDSTITFNVTNDPGGQREFDVALADEKGQPITDASQVALWFTYVGKDLGTSEVLLSSAERGHWRSRGPYLSMVGPWQVKVMVRQPGREDLRTAFGLEVAESGSIRRAGAQVPRSLDTRLVLSLGLALSGVLLAVVYGRKARRTRWGRAAFAGSLAVAVMGVFLTGLALATPTPPPLVNPYLPDTESLATGKNIYKLYCESCHGPQGKGDGPAASTFGRRFEDLGIHVASGHGDAVLFRWISEGIKGTAMPAYRRQLSEEERWHVVNYIKLFGEGWP